MNNMIERVTKAISDAILSYPGDGTPDEVIARAAIEAMRELTPEMIAAGLAVTATWLDIEGSGLTVAREKMRRRYRAAIDEALK